jgi:cytochrome c oxidase subunit I+III
VRRLPGSDRDPFRERETIGRNFLSRLRDTHVGHFPAQTQAAAVGKEFLGRGSLEWLQEMPEDPGSMFDPEIDSRYPLWDQPNFVRDVDEGRFYLSGVEEGKREMRVTSVIGAKPVQCLRIPGPTSCAGGGGLHGWCVCFSYIQDVVAHGGQRRDRAGRNSHWLWTGSAEIPEKKEKQVGHGLTLPLYTSGSLSTGWWAMLITMMADITACVSIVFGYSF